jgi:hypothetical protein
MRFYDPSGEGYEREIGERLEKWRKIIAENAKKENKN